MTSLQPIVRVKKCIGPVEKNPVMKEVSHTFIGMLESSIITNGIFTYSFIETTLKSVVGLDTYQLLF